METLVKLLICGIFGFVHSIHHDICAEIMLVDCKSEALPGSKIYRDSNGKIYNNFSISDTGRISFNSCAPPLVSSPVLQPFTKLILPTLLMFSPLISCTYSQAKCKDTSIDIESVCTCVHPGMRNTSNPSVQMPVTKVLPTLKSTSQSALKSTPSVIQSTMESTSIPTMAKTTPSTVAPMTTAAPATDAPLTSLFCKNKDLITCPPQTESLCGSDGQSYQNSTEVLDHWAEEYPWGLTVHQTETLNHCSIFVNTKFGISKSPIFTKFGNKCKFAKAQCGDPNVVILHEGNC